MYPLGKQCIGKQRWISATWWCKQNGLKISIVSLFICSILLYWFEHNVPINTQTNNIDKPLIQIPNTQNRDLQIQQQALPNTNTNPDTEPIAKTTSLLPISMNDNDYDPSHSVAIAIPVGGRTQRAEQLNTMLTTLRNGGAPIDTIYVIEDVLSRPNEQHDPHVAAVAQKHGINVIGSHVVREAPENGNNFGIHLARHYKFMLDFLLADSNRPLEVGRARQLSIPKYEFLVIIEDDLELSQDFVKWFYAMSRVMRKDDTLYCASAHQDNAFWGTATEPLNADKLDPLK
jgi:hypothetical protein